MVFFFRFNMNMNVVRGYGGQVKIWASGIVTIKLYAVQQYTDNNGAAHQIEENYAFAATPNTCSSIPATRNLFYYAAPYDRYEFCWLLALTATYKMRV